VVVQVAHRVRRVAMFVRACVPVTFGLCDGSVWLANMLYVEAATATARRTLTVLSAFHAQRTATTSSKGIGVKLAVMVRANPDISISIVSPVYSRQRVEN